MRKFLILKGQLLVLLCLGLSFCLSTTLMEAGKMKREIITIRKESFKKQLISFRMMMKMNWMSNRLTNLKECSMMISMEDTKKKNREIKKRKKKKIKSKLKHMNQRQKICQKNIEKNRMLERVYLNSFTFILK